MSRLSAAEPLETFQHHYLCRPLFSERFFYSKATQTYPLSWLGLLLPQQPAYPVPSRVTDGSFDRQFKAVACSLDSKLFSAESVAPQAIKAAQSRDMCFCQDH